MLFVYEKINWSNLQLIFKACNIDISGGTISKRHTLSTVQFNLSLLLIEMGYNVTDIYNSFVVLSKSFQDQDDLIDSESNKTLNIKLKFLAIQNLLTSNIETYNKEIKNLKSEINIRQGNISTFLPPYPLS